MNYKLRQILSKSALLVVVATSLFSTALCAEDEIARIGAQEINYEWHLTGMLYFDKPMSTGASVSDNVAKFKDFNIDQEFSNIFYGGYVLLEHNFYVLPQIKTEISSFEFEKISENYVKQPDGSYIPNRHYSYLYTEEQNYIAYWELMRGNDMQLNAGIQYKIIKGNLFHENLTTRSSEEIGEAYFEKYMPMFYAQGRMQLANGIELVNELSIGIDSTERNFEDTATINYFTKSGLIGMVSYRYKRQDYEIEDITLTNNTHSILFGIGYKY